MKIVGKEPVARTGIRGWSIVSSQENTLASAVVIDKSVSADTRDCDREFEALLACCLPQAKTAGASPDIRWNRLLELADHHRLLPAAWAALRDQPRVPQEVQRDLNARFQKHVCNVLRFAAELAGILEKFDSAGIEVLSHKGPALAQVLYGDAAMRKFGDLDVLVRPADVHRACAALREMGYQQNLMLSSKQLQAYLHTGYEFVFGCSAGKYLVELQWQIVPRFYSIAFNVDALFSRSREIDFDGRAARVLGNEDLIMVLCVHAAKHEWMNLSMVRDIAALAQRDLDWDWIESEARRLGTLNILAISLLLARNLLKCKLPGVFQEAVDSGLESLAQRYQARLRSGEEGDPESLVYFRNMSALRERRRDRLGFALRLAVTPSVSEWESVSLPERWFPLYRLVRGARLLRRFASMRAWNGWDDARNKTQATQC